MSTKSLSALFWGLLAFSVVTQVHAETIPKVSGPKDATMSVAAGGSVSLFNVMTGQIVAAKPTQVGVELLAYNGYMNGTLETEGNFDLSYVVDGTGRSYVFLYLPVANGCLSIGNYYQYHDRVYINSCRYIPEQYWEFLYTSTGALQIQNVQSGQCLIVSQLGNSSSSLRMLDCSSDLIGMNQQWIVGAHRVSASRQ